MLRRAGLDGRIDAASPAFRAGTFGPDPLFNDLRADIRRIGFGMHKRPGREALERLRHGDAAYTAGFFCHYALDRICHPLLCAMEQRGEAKHLAVETALDRILYKKGLGKPLLTLPIPDDTRRTAAQLYPGLSSAGFQRDVNLYLKLRRIMSTSGTPLAGVTAAVLPKFRGLVPFSTPDEPTRRGIEQLERVMRDNIDPAAEQLARCFDALDRDAAFDEWTDADFSGQ